MTEQEARRIAGQAWCADSTKDKVMDIELAMEFARILKREVNQKEDLASGWVDEAKAWLEAARQHCKNEEYYRNLVQQIGSLFGDVAYISDDGSKQDGILCAKVPELVKEALERMNPNLSSSLPRGGYF